MNNVFTVIEDEAEEVEEFFGIEVETPEISYTNTLPRVNGSDIQEIKLNSWTSSFGIHEARHTYHFQVMEDVIEGNEEEAVEYYEGELSEIDTRNSFYERSLELINTVLKKEEAEDIYEKIDSDNPETTKTVEMIFSKNAETDHQVEVFANNSEDRFNYTIGISSAALAGSGLMIVGNYLEMMDLNPMKPEFIQDAARAVSTYPETAAIALSGSAALAGMSYLFAKEWYDNRSSEPLTQENLKKLDRNDRQRALLYNSRVEDNLDDFLDVLDEYGIE